MDTCCVEQPRYSFLLGIEIGHQAQPGDHFKRSARHPQFTKLLFDPLYQAELDLTNVRVHRSETSITSLFLSAFPSIQPGAVLHQENEAIITE